MKQMKCFTLTKLLLLFILICTFELSGCSTARVNTYNSAHDGPPAQDIDVSKIPDAVPQVEPLSRYGNPSSYVVDGYRYHVLKSAKGYSKVGYASWYGTKFHDKLTSTRETYNMLSMTAASTILPLPTYVQVTNLRNGRSVIVKVNDRGPFKSHRIIDLSYAAAKKLGYANIGTALVRVTAIDPKVWLARHKVQQYYATNDTPQTVSNSITNGEKTSSTITSSTIRSTSPFYLQVGAFANETTAANLRTRIAEITNAPVIIKPAYKDHGAIYKVHIGPIYDSKYYDQLRQQLASHGIGNPLIVSG